WNIYIDVLQIVFTRATHADHARGTRIGSFHVLLDGDPSVIRASFRLCYFRKIINISEITMLTMTMVVSGKNSLKPGRSIMKSPGRRPMGSLEIQGQARPTRAMTRPSTMRERCIRRSHGPM